MAHVPGDLSSTRRGSASTKLKDGLQSFRNEVRLSLRRGSVDDMLLLAHKQGELEERVEEEERLLLTSIRNNNPNKEKEKGKPLLTFGRGGSVPEGGTLTTLLTSGRKKVHPTTAESASDLLLQGEPDPLLKDTTSAAGDVENPPPAIRASRDLSPEDEEQLRLLDEHDAAAEAAEKAQGKALYLETATDALDQQTPAVSLLSDLFHSNLVAVVSSIPFIIIYYSIKSLIKVMIASGIPAFRSDMGTACAFCRGLGELTYIWANGVKTWNCNYMLHRYLAWPIDATLAFLMSYFFFDFDPGWASPLIFTLSYALSLDICGCVVDRKVRFAEGFVIAIAAHLTPVLNVFLQVVPTRILRDADTPSYVPVLVVGLGFPFLSFLLRKFVMKGAWKFASRERVGAASDDPFLALKKFSRLVTLVSTSLLVTPAVLCYVGAKSVNQAWGIAVLGVLQEIAVKLIVMLQLKNQVNQFVLRRRIRKRLSSIRRTSIHLGKETSGKETSGKETSAQETEQIRAQLDEEEREEEELLAEKKRQIHRATRVLSIQWHDEIIAEKCSLIGAAFIAVVSFADYGDYEPLFIAKLAGIFFFCEIIVDAVFVYIAVHKFGMHLLSVPRNDVFSKETAMQAMALGVMLTISGLCVDMAAAMKL